MGGINLIKNHEEVIEATQDNNIIHILAKNGSKCIPTIISSLNKMSIEVDKLTYNSPSLDDVYLKYTGQYFEK